MKAVVILAGLFLVVKGSQVTDHIEQVGCYESNPQPAIYYNARDDGIDWSTYQGASGLYKTINKCAEEAQARGILYFAIEFYGECRGSTSLGQTSYNSMTTSTECGAGVGFENAIMVYKGKCNSVYGCCPDGTTAATGLNNEGCPGKDGGWSDFGDWGACSVTCGDGVRSRTRTCTNPAPKNGGADCAGQDTETEACNEGACPAPVDGGWSDWSTFAPAQCSVTCGGGEQVRTRTCTNPAPANGGQDCAGEATEMKKCNEQACPFVCSGKKIDIALIVDTSGSIDENTEFPSVREFLGLFSRAFVLSDDDTQSQLGSIRFSTGVQVTFDFNAYTDNDAAFTYLSNYPYVSGWTNTPAALNLARTTLFTTADGNRQQSDVTPVAIVLTDGESKLYDAPLYTQTVTASTNLKNTQVPNNINLLVVGIGDGINGAELSAMVNSDADKFEMTGFGDLVTRVYDVARRVCNLA